MSIHQRIFTFFAKRRNPSLFPLLKQLQLTEQYSRKELQEYQETQWKHFIAAVYRTNAYYRQLIDATGISIEAFTLDKLPLLPVTTKAELIEYNSRYDNSQAFEKTFLCETSGTSGQVLTFKRNEQWDSFNRASQLRGYSWHGVNFWDKNLYFWGYNFDSKKILQARILDFLMNRFRVFSYQDHAIEQLLERIYEVRYISGYSSMIYELAQRLDGKIDKKRLKLRMIKGTSEKIYPHYSDATLQTFGLPIVSEYGAAESGIIAFSCEHGNMHLNTEGVVVEVDAQQEIIVTNLYAESFPIIRYKLGDAVTLAPEDFQCPCGRPHPVLEEVTGRVGKVILGKTQDFPSLVLYYIFKNLYFQHGLKLNYQAHQHEAGRLSIWLTLAADTAIEHLILVESKKYFEDQLELSLEFSKELIQEKQKLRDFISYL